MAAGVVERLNKKEKELMNRDNNMVNVWIKGVDTGGKGYQGLNSDGEY